MLTLSLAAGFNLDLSTMKKSLHTKIVSKIASISRFWNHQRQKIENDGMCQICASIEWFLKSYQYAAESWTIKIVFWLLSWCVEGAREPEANDAGFQTHQKRREARSTPADCQRSRKQGLSNFSKQARARSFASARMDFREKVKNVINKSKLIKAFSTRLKTQEDARKHPLTRSQSGKSDHFFCPCGKNSCSLFRYKWFATVVCH